MSRIGWRGHAWPWHHVRRLDLQICEEWTDLVSDGRATGGNARATEEYGPWVRAPSRAAPPALRPALLLPPALPLFLVNYTSV